MDMENAKSTENLHQKSSSNDCGGRIQLVLIVITLVIAVLALIVSFIAIGQNGTTNLSLGSYGDGSMSGDVSSGTSDDKIWAIAFGHDNTNTVYLEDETGELRGFNVDLVNAVCNYANKNCKIIHDIWLRCFDSEAGQVARGGVGLMDSWYDACAGWYGTTDRYRTFDFTNPYSRGEAESLFVKKGSPLATVWKDITGKKIGILDGWWTDEFCLLRNKDQFDAGVPLTTTQIIHYFGQPELLAAVNSGEVDYAFTGIANSIAADMQRVDDDPVLPCSLQGPSLMLRKDNTAFTDWFNPALAGLMKSPEYRKVCNDLINEHGHFPGLGATDWCFL